MSILHDDNVKAKLYKYKNNYFNEPPIKYYHIDSEEIVDNIKYVTIRRKIPIFGHLIFMLILLSPIMYINYANRHNLNNQIRTHTIRIPSEMYYDDRAMTLDVDITNDESNFETVSIVLENSKGKSILELNGIKPGESVGAIPINENSFSKLPEQCTVIYKAQRDGYKFNYVKRDVLVVDRSVADKDTNCDF